MNDLVWYAAYGSNLSRARFLTYLTGGLAPRNSRPHHGARDRSPPLDDRRVELSFDVYFAGESKRWGGGVAFLDPVASTEPVAIGRAWLITHEQFEDVIAQENGAVTAPVDPTAITRGQSDLGLGGFYDRLLVFDEWDGVPVVTFTTPVRREPPARPSAAYLATMADGLAEFAGLETDTGSDEVRKKLDALKAKLASA